MRLRENRGLYRWDSFRPIQSVKNTPVVNLSAEDRG